MSIAFLYERPAAPSQKTTQGVRKQSDVISPRSSRNRRGGGGGCGGSWQACSRS